MITGLLEISINCLGVNESCFLPTHSLCAFSFFLCSLPLLKDSWPGLTLEQWTTKDIIVPGLEMDNTRWTSWSRDGGWKRCTVMVLCSDRRWFLRKVHWVHVRSNCDKTISPASDDAHAFSSCFFSTIFKDFASRWFFGTPLSCELCRRVPTNRW